MDQPYKAVPLIKQALLFRIYVLLCIKDFILAVPLDSPERSTFDKQLSNVRKCFKGSARYGQPQGSPPWTNFCPKGVLQIFSQIIFKEVMQRKRIQYIIRGTPVSCIRFFMLINSRFHVNAMSKPLRHGHLVQTIVSRICFLCF